MKQWALRASAAFRSLARAAGPQTLTNQPSCHHTRALLSQGTRGQHPGVCQQQLRRLSSYALPPVVFTSLLLALWTYKCTMLVIFQNKIIYMPFLPPGARQEKISTYEQTCKPIFWRECETFSADGKRIALCVGSVPDLFHDKTGTPLRSDMTVPLRRRVVIFYFQGNASSSPPRLPALSRILKDAIRASGPNRTEFHMVVVSYRGFWKSSGKPSQNGIELDVSAAMSWAEKTYCRLGTETSFILWGQSIGAGVAAWAAEWWLQQTARRQSPTAAPVVDRLILETPFTSIRDMLAAIYPQKWLPYRYLWPFLRNWWDIKSVLPLLHSLASKSDMPSPEVFIIDAEKDELVPSNHASELKHLARAGGLKVARHTVGGALHTEVMYKAEGIKILSSALTQAS